MREIAIERIGKNLLNIVWEAFANQKFIEAGINCFEDLPPEVQSHVIGYFSEHLPRLRWQGSSSFPEGYQKLTPPRQEELTSYLTPFILEQIQESFGQTRGKMRQISESTKRISSRLREMGEIYSRGLDKNLTEPPDYT
ncbi:hypothetical protein HYU14_07675 [Candidatus Woesearchaeota archaeon]|nr:hypothetical protein [Candidatus Woesearchaeota archaeon]